MKAEIITVGTEILLGDIVNTNSQFLAKELASLGIDVYYQSTVGDNESRLMDTLNESLDRSDIIITTGGLGPTNDDITKEVAAKCFNQELVFYNDIWKDIKQYFEKIGVEPTENNKKQAYFPKDCIILNNSNGTAPGAILKKENKMIIVLPGPPKEMIPMFNNELKKHLENLTDYKLISRTLRFFGIGESELEDKLSDIINNQTNPTIAPYAKEGEVTLRITAKSYTKDDADNLIDEVENKIKTLVGKYLYGYGETTLEETVAKLLVEKNLTIAVSESCTGGMVSSMLIDYPGISQVFMEGCVTYSNEAKMSRLGVKKETLDNFGAVSTETAIEMAKGVAMNLKTNVGLSTTGIAGPGGGTTEKPVGLVYIGLYINGKTKVKKLNLAGSREKIRVKATKEALNFLRLELL
ncbi:competence damage-inducible protein A [[Clostridium] sordellii]|uniref:Putative competence-damage inducible protein n=1 Tax=Paraclostridium sordellii TaxID=1505 RepID=A0ABP1XPL6_PARSO|nr:competence/damage-inducible protein A [Paeniclostridium sordellii]CEJ73305.1 putative competence-damage inducible protein,CinA family [[Clostridium] sordellii] [Paeniclostridium sordellii]CEK30362.1 competence damage-inducible protein A [[Clostridium] sordellii] [Paeniclostridium sordellii]CEN68858.1 competence damage-inducible protein A [[Clostridium] sordellii] [Paeniclostridium sordellii]CEN72125.1 competence damage-inducible protein A [[Clostridium] sordellii] [Paeniclostridium sordellii